MANHGSILSFWWLFLYLYITMYTLINMHKYIYILIIFSVYVVYILHITTPHSSSFFRARRASWNSSAEAEPGSRALKRWKETEAMEGDRRIAGAEQLLTLNNGGSSQVLLPSGKHTKSY